jgi:uncharacterized protein YjhX (UPF0386 family)
VEQNEEPCSNIASIRCNDFESNLCEDCSIHSFKTFKIHKLEKIISKSFILIFLLNFICFFFFFFF